MDITMFIMDKQGKIYIIPPQERIIHSCLMKTCVNLSQNAKKHLILLMKKKERLT